MKESILSIDNNPLPPPERYRNALRWLNSQTDYEKALSIPYREMGQNLDRLRRALAFLGNPDRSMRVIHLAGTKGKGSVAMMTERILRDQGARTGLFTSPHLFRLEERFALNGQPCPPDDLADVILDLKERLASFKNGKFTFFEITVLAAFLLFAEKKVDFAILETGLGGRLDATNLCHPVVTAITSVSYDHQKQLGETLPEIVTEKGGIIKKGVPIISGIAAASETLPSEAEIARLPAPLQKTALARETILEAERILHQIASNQNAPWIPVERLAPDVATIPLRSVGTRQPWNAQIALTILDILAKRGIFNGNRSRAIASLAHLNLPARGEIVSTRPLCLVDGAHNRASVTALADAIDQRWPDFQRTLVFAALNEKDVEGMLWELIPRFDQVILTSVPKSPRALSATDLGRIAEKILPFFPEGESIRHRIKTIDEIHPHLAEMFATATPNDLFCFTGSFYFAATVFKRTPAPGL